MDKKEQEKLLTEIMEADAKDGLYEPTIHKMETTQTAVDWLIDRFLFCGYGLPVEWREQAKQMEKEQIQRAFSDGQEIPINHPILPHYSKEEYYNETYNK